MLKYHNITISISARHLETIAKRHDVYSVIGYFDRKLTDEVQGQIVAGNLNGTNTGPSGTGYLPWLNTHGFSTNPNDYPIVDIVDDGIEAGTTLTNFFGHSGLSAWPFECPIRQPRTRQSHTRKTTGRRSLQLSGLDF